MRSTRELLKELLQIRVVPTSVSEWYNLVTVEERGRAFLSEAMQTYEFHIRGVLYSQSISGVPVTIAVPENVERIIAIDVVSNSQGAIRRRAVTDYKLINTPATNLLELNDTLNTWSIQTVPQFFLEVTYEHSSKGIVVPPDIYLGTGMTATAVGMIVSGGTPVDRWPSPGYAEITPVLVSALDYSDVREVVYYSGVGATGFSGLVRGIEGAPRAWTSGIISLVIPAPNNALPVWMNVAQASLYHALISDRAFYDKYTAVASDQAAPPERLMGIARTLEDRADRTYTRTRKLPGPLRHAVHRFRR